MNVKILLTCHYLFVPAKKLHGSWFSLIVAWNYHWSVACWAWPMMMASSHEITRLFHWLFEWSQWKSHKHFFAYNSNIIDENMMWFHERHISNAVVLFARFYRDPVYVSWIVLKNTIWISVEEQLIVGIPRLSTPPVAISSAEWYSPLL